MTEEDRASGVASLSIKLPPFWPSDPQIWFAQVEAQFQTRGITAQKTKYEYVVASLSPEFATEVRDVILKVPDTDQYDRLKAALIERTAASEQRRLQQLFHAEELGDRKPSQLYRRMQQLLGDKAAATDKSFLRELFLQRLPSNVRMVLASAGDDVEPDKLATLADKVMEVTTVPMLPTPPPAVNAVAPPTPPSPDQLTSELTQLRQEVSHLKKLVQSSRQSPARGRGRSPGPRSSQTPAATHCWYHQQFGNAARKCKPPCSYSGNGQARH